MKNTDDVRFVIDQLRKDKIIYAVESVAINMVCILIMMFGSFLSFLPYEKMQYIVPVIPAFGILYTIYMGIGNFIRWRKIVELEKKLKLKV